MPALGPCAILRTAAELTASLHVLRARLLARGRETPEAIEARLTRSARLDAHIGNTDVEIVNDGTPADAALTLLQHLRAER